MVELTIFPSLFPRSSSLSISLSLFLTNHLTSHCQHSYTSLKLYPHVWSPGLWGYLQNALTPVHVQQSHSDHLCSQVPTVFCTSNPLPSSVSCTWPQVQEMHLLLYIPRSTASKEHRNSINVEQMDILLENLQIIMVLCTKNTSEEPC